MWQPDEEGYDSTSNCEMNRKRERERGRNYGGLGFARKEEMRRDKANSLGDAHVAEMVSELLTETITKSQMV